MPDIAISVVIEMFTATFESDVTVEEALDSLGEQDYPPEQVEFLIVTAEDTPSVRELVAKCFGRFAAILHRSLLASSNGALFAR